MYNPNQEDKELLFQKNIESKIKIELLNTNFETIDTLQTELISDNYNVDADSDIRRTYEGTFFVKDSSFFIGENNKIWTNKYIRIWKGRKNYKTNQIIWYKIGIYLFNDTSYTYNDTTKELKISCVDMMSKLNDTFSGQLTGAYSFQIQCEQEIAVKSYKYGKLWTSSSNGIIVDKTCVWKGTSITLSLGEPTPREEYYEFLNSYISIMSVYLIDDTDDSSKIRVSVNDSVITSDFEKGGNIEIPFDRKDKSISIGFLQDISFTKIFIYYVYKEIEAPNTIIQNIYSKSRYYLIFN